MEQQYSMGEYTNDFSGISIICPSPKGKEIAIKLQKCLSAKLFIKESVENLHINSSKEVTEENKYGPIQSKVVTNFFGEDFKLMDVTQKSMLNSKGIVFISSAGIAVRAIAPFLKGKDEDPGVVVVDLSCKYAINILSGHLGGGNELTLKVAEILDAIPIITTASDNLGMDAPDILAKENKLIIEDLKKAKYIASRLIDNKIIGIKDDYNIIQINKGYEKVEKLKEDCIWVTHFLKPEDKWVENKYKKIDFSRVLRLIKKDLVLGIGCRKGTSFEKINDFIYRALEEHNLDISAVSLIVSVDVKANEDGIIKFAEKINCPFNTFSKDEIKTVQYKYDKSEFVEKTLGITGVCEPCVDLSGAEVIISKIKHEGMTLAIGLLKNT
ncbi:cobalt-precorrin 5A hydrolase [Clostridium chromiireducens]|uniref:Cobalamin biosynthesis protein CbiG n=1 Tax=Clostridium chromiireducens TaxID=225345 RepID=A0A1V4IMP8_9CLOT|nr:cobalt-precorrin 5A hydrolase [Clostridium chromiireducens]OPJ61114.1 cobalamin biosynthesis protein CbiG [Clostridium chromiireducens]